MADGDVSSLGRAIDSAPLTGRYWSMCGAVFFSQMFEFFDFAIIGFVVSTIAKPWHLTFGESTIILLTSGLGAIIGSVAWGWLGDKYGRRPLIIASILFFAIGTGLSVFTPTGNWWLLAIFRIVVGIGVGGGNSVGPPTVVEFTPSRHRTLLGGLATVAFVPAGTLLTSELDQHLGPVIGFRGLLAIGFIPVVFAVWTWFSVPESPRWLVSQGRASEAREIILHLFKLPESTIPKSAIAEAASPVSRPATAGATAQPRATRYAGMYRYTRSFWATILTWLLADTVAIGLQLWTPTLLSESMGITTAAAAGLYVFISLAGLGGRIGFSFLSSVIGRKLAGGLQGFGAGILLILVAFTHNAYIGGASMLFVGLLLVQIFQDGGWTNLVPYTSEMWPAELRAQGQGLGNAVGGVGKVAGPAMLGLIAGSSNLVSPTATGSALMPSFLIFAVLMILTGVAFLAIAPETNRRSLETVEADLARGARTSGGMSTEYQLDA
jgi:MFS transporter, putative metabolite:H+ symporter